MRRYTPEAYRGWRGKAPNINHIEPSRRVVVKGVLLIGFSPFGQRIENGKGEPSWLSGSLISVVRYYGDDTADITMPYWLAQKNHLQGKVERVL